MGKPSRDKGYRRERELVLLLRSWGLEAERVPLSGGTNYAKGDVDVYRKGHRKGIDAPLIIEIKGRAKIPEYIKEWLGDHDMLVLHPDRGDRLIIMPEKTLRELL